MQTGRCNAATGFGLSIMVTLAGAGLAKPALGEVIGELGVDWLGNDVIVEYLRDPEIAGVTCHIAYFERGVIDRLQKGNWFEDPSNSAIECQQTGELELPDAAALGEPREIFNSRKSLIWKQLVVKRLYDADNKTLVYVAHSREIQQGSAKMSISTVPLNSGDGRDASLSGISNKPDDE